MGNRDESVRYPSERNLKNSTLNALQLGSAGSIDPGSQRYSEDNNNSPRDLHTIAIVGDLMPEAYPNRTEDGRHTFPDSILIPGRIPDHRDSPTRLNKRL